MVVRSCSPPAPSPSPVPTALIAITDLGVLDPTGQSFRVVERAPGVSEELLQEATGAHLIKD